MIVVYSTCSSSLALMVVPAAAAAAAAVAAVTASVCAGDLPSQYVRGEAVDLSWVGGRVFCTSTLCSCLD